MEARATRGLETIRSVRGERGSGAPWWSGDQLTRGTVIAPLGSIRATKSRGASTRLLSSVPDFPSKQANIATASSSRPTRHDDRPTLCLCPCMRVCGCACPVNATVSHGHPFPYPLPHAHSLCLSLFVSVCLSALLRSPCPTLALSSRNRGETLVTARRNEPRALVHGPIEERGDACRELPRAPGHFSHPVDSPAAAR